LRQQCGAVGREREPVRRAREELQPGFFGQALELQAHRRLRQVEPLGRARHAALARREHEGTQDLEVQGGGSHIRVIYKPLTPKSLAFCRPLGRNLPKRPAQGP
jgi:hypothetical protein